MSQIASITVADGQATPVARTFNPVQAAPFAVYRQNSAGLPFVGEAVITASHTSTDVRQTKRIKLAIPQLEEVNGVNASGYVAAPKLAFDDFVNVEFKTSNRTISANITHLRELLIELLQDPQMVDLIDNGSKPV